MIHVSVGEQDAANGSASGGCGSQNVVFGAREPRVDQSEAVRLAGAAVLAHEVAVDETVAGELEGVFGDASGLHSVYGSGVAGGGSSAAKRSGRSTKMGVPGMARRVACVQRKPEQMRAVRVSGSMIQMVGTPMRR